MAGRRVIYSCVLATLLIASYGVSPTLAAWDNAPQQPPSDSGAPQFEAASEDKRQDAPGPSVLRGAGDPETDIPGILEKTPTPAGTVTQTRESVRQIGPPASAIPSESSFGNGPATSTEQPLAPSPSLLARQQLVVLYGLPGNPDLGVLGASSPKDAAKAALQRAAEYDAINGDDGVKAMLDLVYAQAQAEPTENGLYLRYLADDVVRQYMRLAQRYDLQLMLDLQIGRGDPLDEVKKIERYLRDPRVHIAIDPEYAVGPDGTPLGSPGAISGDQLNAIQDYVSGLVAKYNLPPKIIVIHQFMEETVTRGDKIRSREHVDLVFNMDAFGALDEKARKYSMFSSRGYPARHGFNVFLSQDDRVMSAQEVEQLSPRPDVIFYQ